MDKTKLIFDLPVEMNNRLLKLARLRASNKANLSRIAISKYLEKELKNDGRHEESDS